MLKVVCATVLVLTGMSLITQYTNLHTQEDRILSHKKDMGRWGNMRGYGIAEFYVGHTTAYTIEEELEEQYEVGDELYRLYPLFNKIGSVYIDTSQYEEDSLLLNANTGGILSVTININYLKEFPAFDLEGNIVEVTESEIDWIVLVPEKYRDREKDIREYFYKDKEMRDFYLVKDEGQEMKIIWMENDQYIFSFNPEVFPSQFNKILDPILHVKTENNYLFTYRSGIKGKGLSDPLKLKLIDGSTSLTYEELESELKTYHLDDEVKISSLQEYVEEEVNSLQKEINIISLLMLGVFGTFIFLTVQNMIIFFHEHQKRLVVKRIFGIGFYKTYCSAFSWLIFTSILFILFSRLMDLAQPPMLQSIHGVMNINFLVIILILLGIEVVATVITLAVMENRNKINVIKGGN
ncbi:hypothetical protein [Mechercharimyces sp. CAU 1602]|uniref:hypothetical protein n=1 Tax=Mechercharimyces sp. CAU 1602 TaxID=2973933 RepID=UPI002163849E|nr:hypothetical protein [Mechercharimyces sp. CAU 1602]